MKMGHMHYRFTVKETCKESLYKKTGTNHGSRFGDLVSYLFYKGNIVRYC